MLLNEISVGTGGTSSEVLIRLAISEIIRNCKLANYLQFYSIIGNATNSRKKDGGMTAGTQRAVGSDYGSAKSNTPAYLPVALKIYGDTVKTDFAHERRGGNIGSQRALDLANFSASMGRFMMDTMLNDEEDATHFSGFKEQITSLGRNLVFDTADGGAVPSGHNDADLKQRDKFIEFLNAATEDIDGGADVMLMNGDMIARLETIGRKYLTVSAAKDIYGKEHEVWNYRGVPIVNSGFKADGSGLVIPSNETVGINNDSTSIYMFKFGQETDVSVATNVGLDVKDLGQVGVNYLTVVELDAAPAILNAKAAKRLSGFRLSA